ncbi:sialidase family protein, partial [uncultured Arthrobacter sp.]|uniref:sialidase family protein n=1 Tax=uncultured Arthrobacter sp. TaxID=114050 RepID=UPI0032168E80
MIVGLLVLALAVSLFILWGNYQQDQFLKTLKGKAPLRKGEIQASVVDASPIRLVTVPSAPKGAFTPQMRLGFDTGDQWEPAIAADRFGHVYMLYPQYEGVPGCSNCSNPTMIMQISNDRGVSWDLPFVMYPAGATTGGQWDPQVSVDPVDGRTVFVSFMQNNKSDIVVGKSTDYGATWTFVTAD